MKMRIKLEDDENGPARFPLRDGFVVKMNGGERGNVFISLETEDEKMNLGILVIEEEKVRIFPSGRKLGEEYEFELPERN